MEIDSEKLKNLIQDSSQEIGRYTFEATSFFIGEIENKPILVLVMTEAEAVDTYDYNGLESIPKNLICIKE